jgi:predicted transcriptional regulator of viral defense system
VSEAEERGDSRHEIYRRHRLGELKRIDRGIYAPRDAEPTEHRDLAVAAARAPVAVVCLLSALRFHGLTTQDPYAIWLAIAGKARPPVLESLAVDVAYMSPRALEEGVEEHTVEGVRVRVFSPAKTVADCFKYRHRVGLDVAVEALRDYRHSARYEAEALWHYAGVCRVRTVIRPYAEAIG